MARKIRLCLVVLLTLCWTALAQDLTPEMRAEIDRRIKFQLGWDGKLSSPGAQLRGVETARKKYPDGYIVSYQFQVQGLPSNLNYHLLTMPTMASRPEEIQNVGDVSVEEKTGRVIDGPNDPRSIILPHPAPGEPYRFALVSEDEKYRAAVTLLPNPVKASDHTCSVNIVRMLPHFELALVELKGIPPQTDVDFSGNSEGEVHSGKMKADADGVARTGILPFKAGKSKGKMELQFRSAACALKIGFKWGATEEGKPFE